MGVKDNQKKICSLYVSDWHFITMITPYINEKIEKKEKVIILTQKSCKFAVNTFLTNLTLNDIKKSAIKELNWNETKINDWKREIEKVNMLNENDITIIIKGESEYIEKINIDLKKTKNMFNNKRITVVNCYDVSDFNQNLMEILKKHDKILNTAGEREIADVFEGVS